MKSLKVVFALLCFTICISCSDQSGYTTSSENTEIELRQMAAHFDSAPCLSTSNIQIVISEDCGPNWTQGILDAINAYNDTNTGINMTTEEIKDANVISISCVDIATPAPVGIAEFPLEDGAIGKETFLNTAYEDLCENPCYYQGIVMHELGHNLGIAHNHEAEGDIVYLGDLIYNEDGTFSYADYTPITFEWIEDTAPPGSFDWTSVFGLPLPGQHLNCDAIYCNFNENDILALETLFPRPDESCDCPRAFEPCECEESCYCPDFVTPCSCPDEFEPCACEQSLTITFPNFTSPLGCIPSNSTITVCAEFSGPAPNNITWGFSGNTPASGPTGVSGNSSTADNCTSLNVGSGGTVSVWVENGDCSFSVSKELNMCHTTTVLPPGLNLHITP